MSLKFMHLLDACMLEVYRDKILLERSVYSQNTTDIWFFSATMSKSRFKILFSRIAFDYFKTRTKCWKKKFDIFLKNSIIIVANLSFPTNYFRLTKRYIPWKTGGVQTIQPNKPAKYCLLFKSINASRYPYSFVSAPYCGNPVGEQTEE